MGTGSGVENNNQLMSYKRTYGWRWGVAAWSLWDRHGTRCGTGVYTSDSDVTCASGDAGDGGCTKLCDDDSLG